MSPADHARYQAAVRREQRATRRVLRLEDLHHRAAREVLDAPPGSDAHALFRGMRERILRALARAREQQREAEAHTTQMLAEGRGVLT